MNISVLYTLGTHDENDLLLAGPSRCKSNCGRQSVDMKRIQMDTACEKAVTTLMRLSLATPSSIGVAESENIILVHGRKQAPCLDEASLAALTTFGIHQVGDNITAPIVKQRVEPEFPESARRAMPQSGTNVMVIVSCVITREGCVRSVNLLSQSPFPTLNGAALQAISQWTFEPGRLHEPVDVVFNLTVNFKIP
jgi:TonB family protein